MTVYKYDNWRGALLSTGSVLMSRAKGPDSFLYQALTFKPPETETDTSSCAKVRP